MGRTEASLQRLGGAFAAMENGLLVFLLAALTGLAGTQILLRNLLDTAFIWGDPLLRVLVMWVGLVGAMVATREDNHIHIDLVSRYLAGPARAAVRVITGLSSALICAILAWHGARFVALDFQAQTSAFASVPTWLCELIIPVGFAIMALRFLTMALVQLMLALRGRS